jgi:uncharacterized protein involved in outer membrane biogenesis
MTAIKVTYRILVAGFILLLGIGFAYRYAETQNFFFPKINSLVEVATGYTLKISGPLEATLFPRPGVTLRSFAMSNPGSPMGAEIIKAERLSISLDWASLVRLKPVIDIDMESTDINLKLDHAGDANWLSPERSDKGGEVPFEIDKIQASNIRFRFNNHQTDELLELDIGQLDTDISSGQARAYISSVGRFQGQRFLAQGEVNFLKANRILDLNLNVSVAPASSISVAEVEVPSIAHWIESGKASFPVHGTIQGSMSIAENLPYGDLLFRAEANTLKDLTFLQESLNFLRPELGPISASGNLQFRGSDLDITGLQAGFSRTEGEIDVGGRLQNLLSEIQMDLEVSGRVDRLDQFLASEFLAAQGDLPLSSLESIRFASSLTNGMPGMQVSAIDAHFRYRSLNAEIQGGILIEEEKTISDLGVFGRAEKANDMLELFGVEYVLPSSVESVNVRAQIRGENDNYKIEGGTFSTENERMKGAISGVLDTSGDTLEFKLSSQIEIDDLVLISSVFPADAKPYLLELGVQAEGEIAGSANNFAINNTKIDLFRDDKRLHLRGDLTQLPDKPASDFSFQYVTSEPVTLDKYFSELEGLHLTGPMDLSGTVRSGNDRLTIQNIQLQAKQTDMGGDIVIDLGVSPPRVSANLSSGKFITQLFESETEEAPQTPPSPVQVEQEVSQSQTKAKKKLSSKELGEAFKAYTSNIMIETDWIQQLNISFSYTADKALVGNYEVDKLRIILKTHNNVFTLEEYSFNLKGRPTSFRGMINANPTLPVYELEGMVLGDTLETLMNIEDGLLEGGELKVEFMLNSAGRTLGELIENLQGQATANMGPLKIRSNILNTVSSGIFSVMLNGILSKKEDESVSTYQCGILGIDISNGVAQFDKGLALQSEDYNLAGNGSIDLNTGAVDIKVSPKARKGLGLSISTIINGFKVQGHMATPDLGVTGGGLVSAAILGYALTPVLTAGAMTNPVSATVVATGYLAKGLIDRMTAQNYTCENTRDRILLNRARKSTSTGASAPSREF